VKNELKILTRLQLCNIAKINEVRHGDESKKKRMMVEFISIFVIGILIIFLSTKISQVLISQNMGNVVPGILMGIGSILILILSLYRAGEVLFSYSTYERLITLPLSHFTIIVSRFIRLYVEQLLVALAVVLPGMIVFAASISLSPVGWICTIVGILLIPLIPIAVAAIIDFLALSVTARMRHRGVASTIVSILALLALFFAVFLLMGKPENLINTVLSAGNVIGMVYPPAGWFGAGITGDILQFLLFAAVSLIVGILLILLFAKTFQKISASIQERASSKKFVMTEQEQISVKKSLIKMEVKRFFGTRPYVLNCFFGYMLAIIASVVLLVLGIAFRTTGLYGDSDFIEFANKFNYFLPLILIFLCCLAPTTSASISIEGKNWWILKTMPISMKKIAKAKARLNLLLALPCSLFGSLICCIAVPMTIPLMILTFLLPIAAIFFSTYLCLLLNMKIPNLTWENVTEAIKSGPVVMIGVGVCFGIIAISGILAYAISPELSYTIMTVLLIIATLITVRTIGKINVRDIE